MDRNGLRPLRYTLTKDYLITGSETGMIPIKEEDILEKGRVGPGQMIGINFNEKKFYNDRKIKNLITKTKPYEDWVKNITHLSKIVKSKKEEKRKINKENLYRKMFAFGWSVEDLELILTPMVLEMKEATGSMGDDSVLASLSEQYRGLHHYFKQNFNCLLNLIHD